MRMFNPRPWRSQYVVVTKRSHTEKVVRDFMFTDVKFWEYHEPKDEFTMVWDAEIPPGATVRQLDRHRNWGGKAWTSSLLVLRNPRLIWTDFEMCSALIGYRHAGLEKIPQNFRTYKICKKAVEYSGFSLQYVPRPLITPELCKIAVDNDSLALQFVPMNLKTPELCMTAFQKNAFTMSFFPEHLMTPEICLESMRRDGRCLSRVPDHLMTPEMCKLAVRRRGSLWGVPERFKTLELCKLAVAQSSDCDSLCFVPSRFMNDPELIRIAFENHWTPNAILYSSQEQENERLLRYFPNVFLVNWCTPLPRHNYKFITTLTKNGSLWLALGLV